MEIGLIYSSKDPRQAAIRRFLDDFLRERGILAHIEETEKPVDAPTIVIDGQAVTPGIGNSSRGSKRKFPGIPAKEEIARALERSCWGL